MALPDPGGPCLASMLHSFRGMDYQVSMDVVSGCDLMVEVEDRVTADQWRSTFDQTYVEELTRKTGNYKQFDIFVSMLETAILKKSESVTLDLLTYTDLELLRAQKGGTGSQHIPASRNNNLSAKRYLIVTYTAEFDRIHYPLPLPYVGKPDPKALQEVVRKLRKEIKSLKLQSAKEFRHKELERLRKDYDKLLIEKEELEEEFLVFRREVGQTSTGSAAKEVRMLKDLVKTLEQNLLEEQMKHQRATTKRSQEQRELRSQVDELRASERNLKVRLKSLTNELAMYKRGRTSKNTSNISASSRYSAGSRRSSARNDSCSSAENGVTRLRGRDGSHVSRTSRNDSYNSRRSAASTPRERSASRDLANARTSRERSLSWDRSRTRTLRNSGVSPRNASRERPASRERSASRDRPGVHGLPRAAGGLRSRSPSPVGYARFDPSAYIKEKERQKKEANLKQRRQQTRSRLSTSAERGPRPSPNVSRTGSLGRVGGHSRASSVSSLRSRNSSIESLSDVPLASDSSGSRYRMKFDGPHRHDKDRHRPSAPEKKERIKKVLSSTPENQRTKSRTKGSSRLTNGAANDYLDRSAEISEIDERLNRLQQFMKTHML